MLLASVAVGALSCSPWSSPGLYNAHIVGRVVPFLPYHPYQSFCNAAFALLSTLRETSGGATMITPGEAGTTFYTKFADLVSARRIGFSHWGRGLMLLTPAFVLPRSYTPLYDIMSTS